MRKLALLILLIPLYSSAFTSAAEGYEFIAERCKTIECTSHMIRRLDDQISALIVKRTAYVKVQAQLRAGDVLAPKTLRTPEQQAQGVANRAKSQGFSPGAADKIFNAIHEESNVYEQKIMDENN